MDQAERLMCEHSLTQTIFMNGVVQRSPKIGFSKLAMILALHLLLLAWNVAHWFIVCYAQDPEFYPQHEGVGEWEYF